MICAVTRVSTRSLPQPRLPAGSSSPRKGDRSAAAEDSHHYTSQLAIGRLAFDIFRGGMSQKRNAALLIVGHGSTVNPESSFRKAKSRHTVKRDGSLQGTVVCIDLLVVNIPCHCFFISRHRK